MEKFDDNFLEFLKAYEPSDFYKVVSGDAKPEVLNHIYDDHKRKFAAWLKVPPPLRYEYGGRVPDEILAYAENGNIQALRNIARDRPANYSPELEKAIPNYIPPTPAELALTATFITAINAGYNQDTSKELALNHDIREQLSNEAKKQKRNLNDEERKLWQETRRKDKDAIKRDWAQNQPEKMLLRLFREYNKGKIEQKEFLPQVADLMQKIENNNRQEHLLKLLHSPRFQARLALFRPEVLDTLSQAILKVLPEEEKTKYLQKDISLDAPINYLIQRDGKGDKNTAPVVNKIVKHAKDKGIKIDLNEFGEKSENPMPLHLRQMFMVACKLNDVEYSPVNGEKINMSSDYVKSLPNDIQAILVAKNMKDAKNQMNNNPQVRNQQNTRG